MGKFRTHWLWPALLIAVGCSGSHKETDSSKRNAPTPSNSALFSGTPAPTSVSDRPGNTSGKVFIVEYHNLQKKEGRWVRSLDNFRNDLERIYKMGFRPITVGQYVTNTITIPKGASPIVFTFDDADPTQFRLQDDGSIDPECAVGIWKAFADKHPDFPIHATFYVLPTMWGQPKWVTKKVQMIKDWGSELGNHTVTHPKLSHLTDAQVVKELGQAMENIQSYGFTASSVALPFGISPKNKSLLQEFVYNGKHYGITSVMLVGAGPAPSPTDPKFNRYRIPRIQGIDQPYGITYWLKQVDDGHTKLWVHP